MALENTVHVSNVRKQIVKVVPGGGRLSDLCDTGLLFATYRVAFVTLTKKPFLYHRKVIVDEP